MARQSNSCDASREFDWQRHYIKCGLGQPRPGRTLDQLYFKSALWHIRMDSAIGNSYQWLPRDPFLCGRWIALRLDSCTVAEPEPGNKRLSIGTFSSDIGLGL